MSETYPAPSHSNSGANLHEWTVSEISGAVKKHIETEFDHIRVRGELGRVSRPQSGHVYLDIKDEKASLSAVIWKGVAHQLPIQPEQGMEVVCTGRLTTYAGQSRYQLVIENLEAAGEGALMAVLEQRKKALAAEGLFDESRKRALPLLPETIGVITSPSGAVIRDILHRLEDRFPRRVMVWPVRVQGKSCSEEVARAIAGFNALGADEASLPRPDLLIIARGGGSLEDLWGFNEEIVARTIAQSDIPIISAIGHETDTTLADFAADWRAPTPTAAAERAVPVRRALQADVMGLAARMASVQARRLEQAQERVVGLARGLPRIQDMLILPAQRLDAVAQRLSAGLGRHAQTHAARLARVEGRLRPTRLSALLQNAQARLKTQTQGLSRAGLDRTLAQTKERLAERYERLSANIRNALDGGHMALESASRQLALLSYENVLRRGFALVLDDKGAPIRHASTVKKDAQLDIRLANDQRIGAKVIKTSDDGQDELL